MKLFNIENGIEKLYVQREDLMNLCETTFVPQSIYDKYKFSLTYCKSPKDFVEFSHPDEIKYLNNLDWILDYREYILKSEEELTELGRHYENRINDIAITYNDMSVKERRKNYILKKEHDYLTYKYYNIIYTLRLIRNNESINLPKVVDYKGFSFEDNESIYILKTTLDNNTYFIERKDNKSIKEDEIVPRDFIEKCIKTILFYRLNDKSLNEEFSVSYNYDYKKRCVVIEIDTNIKEVDEEVRITELKSDEGIIKKLVNKFKRD